MSSEAGQTDRWGALVLGGNGGKQGSQFVRIEDTWNGQVLLDSYMNNTANRGFVPIDSTIDFTDMRKWKPGAEQAILGATKWDDKIGLLADYGVMDKWGLAPESTFMDKLIPALILSAVGMGAGQMFQAANAGGFLPAAQSGFESGAMFSGGAGGVQGGAVAGGVGGGGGGLPAMTAEEAASLMAENSFDNGAMAQALGYEVPTAGAAAGGQAANNLGNVTGSADGTAGATGNPPPGGGPGGAGSITDTIKNIYNTVKPYKDALSLVQAGASVIQGVNNRNAMSDAADKQAATAAEQLRQQQAAQQAQEEAAKQALELQRQAQEKLLAQQNAQLQEQLRLQQSMASYQQQVYSQQLAQAAKDARLAEEQLRRNSQRSPDFASVVSGNRRAGTMGVGGTMLTGADGVDPQSLLLGRATLLGG